MSCGIKRNCSIQNCKNCFHIKTALDLVNKSKFKEGDYKYFEVKFKNDRREILLNKTNENIQIGVSVVVKTSSGWDIGIVTLRGIYIEKLLSLSKKSREEIDKETFILRIANSQDIEKWKHNIKKEQDTLKKVRELAKGYNLSMKVSDVEYQADGQKMYIYYVAEDRIDFRELLKEVILKFKKKIELKQIGQRQEAGKIGGIGGCGLELCCSSWLKDFRSVNIEAVRYQQLSINSDKIIGSCGKLKCCMNYELDSYVEKLKEFPSKKILLRTKKGDASLVKIDVFKEFTWYSYVNNDDRNLYKIRLDKVNISIKKNEQGSLLNSLEDISEE